VAVLAIALACVIRSAAFHHSSLPLTAEWIAHLSDDRCPPELRLPDRSAGSFLGAPQGLDRRTAVRLRRERCQAFRDYLQSLQDDFGRATLALKVLLLQSRRDRPDLAVALLHHQLTFGCRMVAARTRLVLYGWGIGAVDVSRIEQVFRAVVAELHAALPAGVAA
jgi:hypothetical protein